MELDIAIDEKAKQLISKKGNLITISSQSIENCCVPINEVSVLFNKPDNPQMFNEMKTGNISLYVDKKLEFKNQLINIKHTGVGPFQTVKVDGIVRF